MSQAKIAFLLCATWGFSSLGFSTLGEDRWWPVQEPPKALVRMEIPGTSTLPRLSVEMMAQSVAGLAAKAVNEGRGNELVWVNTGNTDEEDWLARLLERKRQIEVRGTFGVWNLIDRYSKTGVIRGYLLYRADHSQGSLNAHRPGIDRSVNVATSLAGLLDGVLVDEALEAEAKSHGLRLLMDVRDKSQEWCFETYNDQFTRRMVCTQDPQKANVRDLAIAQKAFTFYGDGKAAAAVMKWLEPLSPIAGDNGGDEFQRTDLSSRWGHIQTSTDWCMNLPVLMVATERNDPPKTTSFNPQTIDWRDRRSGVAFITTDGDNVQRFEGNFFRSSEGKSYWGSPDRGRIPFGWSFCLAHLVQLCPDAIEYARTTQSPNDCLIEWGGGYYYPDRFGLSRSNRWDWLAQHARRTWELMKKINARLIGFNVAQHDSADALKAYQVFASETDGLLAILVFQYDRYEAGAGKVFWVRDRRGNEVPVITARYSIWEHTNRRERSGTPAKVAREIVQTVHKTGPDRLPRYDWVIAHAWSWFRKSAGSDENSEDMSQEDAASRGGERGVAPVLWCANRLPPDLRVMNPEELVWRLRMRHDPEQARRLIQDWRP